MLGDFGAVALMRFETFSFAIYTQYASAFNRGYAAWLALMLVALTLVLVVLELRLLGSRRYARVGSGSGRQVARERLGPYAPLAYAFVAFVILASIGLPVTTLVLWMVLVPPELAQLRSVLETFVATARLALPTALIATLFALPVALASTRAKWFGGRLVERLVYLGYAIPPMALALAFVMFALRAAPWLYQTYALRSSRSSSLSWRWR